MNREIKFRAKVTQWFDEPDNPNKFVYWDIWATFYYTLLVDERAYVDFSTVEEWTGLKDKHGKDIYEGDIVKHRYSNRQVVEFLDGEFIPFGGDINVPRAEDSEVIGNIQDNPELLEAE